MREVVAVFLSGENGCELPKLPTIKRRQYTETLSEETERAIQCYQSWFPSAAPSLTQHQSFKYDLFEWMHERIVQQDTTIASIGPLVARVRRLVTWADVVFRLWTAKVERQLLESSASLVSSSTAPGECFEMYGRLSALEAATNAIICDRLLSSLGPLHQAYCASESSGAAQLAEDSRGVQQCLSALAEQSLEKYRMWFETKFLDSSYLTPYFSNSRGTLSTEGQVRSYYEAESRFAKNLLPKSTQAPYMAEVARFLFSSPALPRFLSLLVRERSLEAAPLFDALEALHPKNTLFAVELSWLLREQFAATSPTDRYFFELVLAHQVWVKAACRNRPSLLSVIDEEVSRRFRDATPPLSCADVCRSVLNLHLAKNGNPTESAALVACGLRMVSLNLDPEHAVSEFCRLLLHRIQRTPSLSDAFVNQETDWARTLTLHFGARAYPAVLLARDAKTSAEVEKAVAPLSSSEGPELHLRFYNRLACPAIGGGVLLPELRAQLANTELVFHNLHPKRQIQWVPSLTILHLEWKHQLGCTPLSVTANQYHMLRLLETRPRSSLRELMSYATWSEAQCKNALCPLIQNGVVVSDQECFAIAAAANTKLIDAVAPGKSSSKPVPTAADRQRLRTALDVAVVQLVKHRGRVLLPISVSSLPPHLSEVRSEDLSLCVDRLCQREYCAKVDGELRYIP